MNLVTAVGCEDMVIVETKDAVFVAPKDRVQDVKELVARLKSDDRSEVEYHREVYRPWGKYDSVDVGARQKGGVVIGGLQLRIQVLHVPQALAAEVSTDEHLRIGELIEIVQFGLVSVDVWRFGR